VSFDGADRTELSTGQAARYLGIHPDTLRDWAKAGRVGFWTTPGGQRRFNRADLDLLKAPSVHDPLEADDSPADGAPRAASDVEPERSLPRKQVA